MHKLSLFGDPPLAAVTQRGAGEDGDADGDGLAAAAVTQRGAQEDGDAEGDGLADAAVAQRGALERYAKRWPMIPSTELHASSVQHPSHLHLF